MENIGYRMVGSLSFAPFQWMCLPRHSEPLPKGDKVGVGDYIGYEYGGTLQMHSKLIAIQPFVA